MLFEDSDYLCVFIQFTGWSILSVGKVRLVTVQYLHQGCPTYCPRNIWRKIKEYGTKSISSEGFLKQLAQWRYKSVFWNNIENAYELLSICFEFWISYVFWKRYKILDLSFEVFAEFWKVLMEFKKSAGTSINFRNRKKKVKVLSGILCFWRTRFYRALV